MIQAAAQRESFPKLDLIAAKAAMDRDPASVCLFELDRKIVGQLFIPYLSESDIIVNYLFSVQHMGSYSDEVSLKTITVASPLDPFRRYFVCPECAGSYWSLYFKTRWGCGDCLGLRYRRQLVDKEVLLWERRKELDKQLRHGRPKGMHNSTYFKLKRKQSRLEALLEGKMPKDASDAQNLIIHARWISAAEADLWSPHYTVRGGEFVRLR